MANNIADKAKELVEPLAQNMGLEVVDVEYVRENAEWSLRVYIDKRGGVRIDDCEELSKAFSTLLDEADIVNKAYNLVVSSPGLDRPLKTEADFRRYSGELLDICMLPGRLKLEANSKEGPPAKKARNKTNNANKAITANKANRSIIANKANKANKAINADMISGTLDRFEAGRIYLIDVRGSEFSLAWEDVKTAKRAIRF